MLYLNGHNHGLEHYTWDRNNILADNTDLYGELLSEQNYNFNKNKWDRLSYLHSIMSGAAGVSKLHLMSDPDPNLKDNSVKLRWLARNEHGFFSVQIKEDLIKIIAWNQFGQEIYSTFI